VVAAVMAVVGDHAPILPHAVRRQPAIGDR